MDNNDAGRVHDDTPRDANDDDGAAPRDSAVPLPTKPRLCRFFRTPKGCRLGKDCRFMHVEKLQGRSSGGGAPRQRGQRQGKKGQATSNESLSAVAAGASTTTTGASATSTTTSRRTVQHRPGSGTRIAITRAPQPSTKADPIAQLLRRFPGSTRSVDGRSLCVAITPSDPDFPFDLERLLIEFDLNVTDGTGGNDNAVGTDDNALVASFARSLRVVNADIPADVRQRVVDGVSSAYRQFVATAHDSATSTASGKRTLVQWMNWIDRHMEALMLPARQQTSDGSVVKFVVHKGGAVSAAGGKEIASAATTASMGSATFTARSDSEAGVPETHSTTTTPTTATTIVPTTTLPATATPELLKQTTDIARGIRLRLEQLTIHTIALLQCTHITLLIRCNRCKHHADVPALQPHKPRSIVCGTCQAVMRVVYRPEAVHAGVGADSVGFVDVEGCRLVDVLSIQFLPTCGQCANEGDGDGGGVEIGKSDDDVTRQQDEQPKRVQEQQEHQAQPQLSFKKVVRGGRQTLSCRFCHARMALCFEEVRFQLAGGALDEALGVPETSTTSAKAKAKAAVKDPAIVAGQPLPDHGACRHYGKSFRWFRFPCCGRAYPCDICHEELSPTPHDLIRATRMLCGHCAREQPIPVGKAASTCAQCGEAVAASTSTRGFWEGGKGVRDRAKMSRNDGKKYSGLGKTMSRRQQDKLDRK